MKRRPRTSFPIAPRDGASVQKRSHSLAPCLDIEVGPHLCVLLQVRKSGSRVMFLLVDKETDRRHREQNIKFKREAASLTLLPQRPRLVEMKKGSDGYGFYLRASPEQGGKALNAAARPSSPQADSRSLRPPGPLQMHEGSKGLESTAGPVSTSHGNLMTGTPGLLQQQEAEFWIWAVAAGKLALWGWAWGLGRP